jgi:signal transduction histidine kinase
VDLDALVRRVVALQTDYPVAIERGPRVRLRADADQIEQLLINLLRNAVDASREKQGSIQIRWSLEGGPLQLLVEDQGPGLPQTANLFVPFFTTKVGGSGIGLVLSRQIAEAHGGTLDVENRDDGPGCRARLTLPLRKH